MEMEYWVLDTPVDNDFIGGYQSIYANIRETIHLGKKEQKLLHKLVNYGNNKIQLSGFRKASLEEFRLDMMPPGKFSKKYSIDCFPWHEVRINHKMPHFKIAKEKLKLDIESKRLFVWLKDLSIPQIKCDPIIEHKREIDEKERFKIDVEFLHNCFDKHSRPKNFEPMPSFLDSRFKETLQENISKTVSFAFDEKLNIKHQIYKTSSLKEYMLDVFKGPKLQNQQCNLRKWPVPNAHRNKVIFEILRSQLFDLEFNELEFFKITTKPPSNERKLNKKWLKKGWKLSKNELKQLNWDPFKKIDKTSTAEILSIDAIPKQTFRPQQHKIRIEKLLYSSLDLINLEQINFESIRFNSAGRPAPTIVEESSISSTSEKETQGRESAEPSDASMIPQKRSFIDEDLLSILHSKKKNRKFDDTETSRISHGATMFHILNQETNRYQELRSSPSLSTLEQPLALEIPYEPVNEPREILLNVSKIKKNLEIIQYLNNETKLRIVEQCLPSECDFVLDSTSCIIILKLDLFFQLQTDSTLFYENTLKSLVTEFKNVVILMKYSEIMDKADIDTFWKIRLYLQPPEFQVFMTQENHEQLAQWVDMLSEKTPSIDDVQQLNSHPLTLLHINKFLVQELLSNYTLEQLLLKATSSHSKELLKWLTSTQLKRIKKLMALGW